MTRVATAQARQKTLAPAGMPSQRLWLAVGLFVLGAGAAAVALLGPLVFDVIRYHASEEAVNQVTGGDVAGLILVAPVSITAAIMVWRRHVAGPVLALGPAVYALYMYSQLALGGDVSRYPGNSEMFFPLFLGLFILAGAIAIGAWGIIDASELSGTSQRVSRTFGWFAVVVAIFLVVGLHLRGLVSVWAGDPGSEYLADPVVFWLVKFMDLGLVVPALLAVGIGVLRGAAWAAKAEFAAVGWIALLGSSVAGMAIMMQVNADPAATMANTITFGSFALIGLGMALLVYKQLFTRGNRSRSVDGS